MVFMSDTFDLPVRVAFPVATPISMVSDTIDPQEWPSSRDSFRCSDARLWPTGYGSMSDQIPIPLDSPGDEKPTGEPDAVLTAPFGALAVYMQGARLAHVVFLQNDRSEKEAVDPETREVVRQLKRYLADPRASFDLRLDLKGSPFQRQVWKALQQISVGVLVTYGDIAEQLDSSARAVGGACRANPVPIVVPCHRVVSAQGLGGFSGESRGYPIEAKRWLLVHEGALLM